MNGAWNFWVLFCCFYFFYCFTHTSSFLRQIFEAARSKSTATQPSYCLWSSGVDGWMHRDQSMQYSLATCTSVPGPETLLILQKYTPWSSILRSVRRRIAFSVRFLLRRKILPPGCIGILSESYLEALNHCTVDCKCCFEDKQTIPTVLLVITP